MADNGSGTNKGLSRRAILKGTAAGAGALTFSGVAPLGFVRGAWAQNYKPIGNFPARTEGATIKFGFVVPQTGAYADEGADELRAYDLAVMHGAWCFSGDGAHYFADRAASLIAGYEAGHGLSDEERAALSVLCRGASLRFMLTRAYDWINTPAGALVTRKDPLAYARRLEFYRSGASLA